MHFTRPELKVQFERNLDATKITSTFIEVCRTHLGRFTSHQINRDNFDSDIDSQLFLNQEQKSKRIYPSHSFFSGQTESDYWVSSSANVSHDGSWQSYLEIRAGLADDSDPRHLADALLLLVDLAKHYAANELVMGVQVRKTLGGNWTPVVPGSGSDDYLRLVRHPETIQKFYPDSADFQKVWDQSELTGQRIIFSRALDILDIEAFQEKVYPRIWDLARRAYPGNCKYFPPTFTGIPSLREKEIELFYQGEKCLSWVGYDPINQLAQATAYAEEGIHIPPNEILGMQQVITSGKMPDEKPVKTLQIIFPSREMAMREGVPLLDIGAKVFYLNHEMQNQELIASDFEKHQIH